MALLPELTELVRALKTYSDKDVAETAERVVVLLEELQTAESIAREDRRRAKEKQRTERLHLRAVKAADHASARAAKGGKRKGPAPPARVRFFSRPCELRSLHAFSASMPWSAPSSPSAAIFRSLGDTAVPVA